jgi:hypothetical protein
MRRASSLVCPSTSTNRIADVRIIPPMKEWKQKIVKVAKEWGLQKLEPPANTHHYLNRFTSIMKQLVEEIWGRMARCVGRVLNPAW